MTAQPTKHSAATDVSWTIRRVLEWTTDHLRRHGSQTPRLDAEILLAHARGCQRIKLYTRYEGLLSNGERQAMRELVQRRAQHEPVAYLVGHREFFSLNLRVTSDVLIPRPDTETLVVELLERLKGQPEPRILDVGTGSGCIAVAVAVNKPDAQVTAIDISLPALEIARVNASQHQVAGRIRFLQGDLFATFQSRSGSGRTGSEKFEIIVSNPPYVAEGEWETLQADVRLHEPRLSLLAGPDGLDVIRRVVAEASDFLVPGGHLLLEIDPGQAETVTELLRSQETYEEIGVSKDLAGKERLVYAGRRS